jgi:RsiW-degrading membrane proteinase PrsW (M82 family)
MKCPNCDYSNRKEVKLCLKCGHEFAGMNQNEQDPNSLFYEFSQLVDGIPINHRSVRPKFQNIFSRVFRKHSDVEAERLFIVGTSLTTPTLDEVAATWPKPWLFTRVFLIALVSYLGLYVGVSLFHNINFIPGLIIIGSFAVPITTLIFFWEMNAPQNIAIYKIVYVVFIGGILSLLLAVIFYDILRHNINPVTIGIVEELSKVVAVIFFVRPLKYKYVLNGLLIGAAIGVGFAAFETAGYALRALLSNSYQMLYYTIIWRSIFSPGGHVAWGALAGAALCRVQGDSKLRFYMLFKPKFLFFFVLVVAFHALWDSPWLGNYPIGQLFLMILSWVIVFRMIKIGLNEINEKKRSLSAAVR